MSGMPILEGMQRYYDLRASEYDQSMGYDDSEIVASLEPVTTFLREAVRGHDALELACGPGFWTSHAAETARSIVATDFNESTLKQASEKQLPAKRVTLAQADAYKLGAIPGIFTALYAVDWLSHVPLSRLPAFLRSAVARVEPGSPVIFIDQLTNQHPKPVEYDDEGNPLQMRTLADGSTHKVIKHFFTPEELAIHLAPLPGKLVVTTFESARRHAACFFSLVEPTE